MFRLFRPRKNIFSLGARVNSTQASTPEVVRIQRVKFRRKRFKVSNLVIAAGVYYACYEIYTRAIFGTLGRWLDEEEAHLTEKEREELDEAAEPLFIPFPGFTKMVEPPPFRSTDPEWQTYVKISKNQALLKSIRGNLAELARRAVSNHPVLMKRCGKETKVSKYWLDLQYPYKPPPTFVRQGLSFDEDGISWTEQPVDSLAVFRTRQALWPSALTLSLWSFSSALMTQNAITIAKFFGYETKTDPLASMQQTIERIHQQLKKPPGKSDPDSSSSLPSPGQTSESSATGALPSVDKRSAGSTTTPETLGSGAGVGNAVPSVPSAKDMYGIRTAQEHTSGPWDKFKQKLAQKWQKAPDYPPRGSISVSGLVEINTPRAIIIVDAYAWWDPQTEKFDPRTIVLRLRTVRPKQQAPLR
ncbi:hypothetical protein F5Y19DRAFT_475960 [Xylariaceae sp. FL1651]|nr:hypothetical protein F5Y19DRAFT_475960 [Xylariaceae sp. FL1651]